MEQPLLRELTNQTIGAAIGSQTLTEYQLPCLPLYHITLW